MTIVKRQKLYSPNQHVLQMFGQVGVKNLDTDAPLFLLAQGAFSGAADNAAQGRVCWVEDLAKPQTLVFSVNQQLCAGVLRGQIERILKQNAGLPAFFDGFGGI